MNTFILTIVLLDPLGYRGEINYYDLTEPACIAMRKVEVDAVRNSTKGWRLVSANCVPSWKAEPKK